MDVPLCYAKRRRRRRGEGIHLVMIICWTVTDPEPRHKPKVVPFWGGGVLMCLYLYQIAVFATFTEHARAESGV